jgi:hypothetical protein
MKLGAVRDDPDRVASAPAHAAAAAEPAAVLDRSDIEVPLYLDQNDTLPVCTIAALDNAASMVAAINGFSLITDHSVIPIYAAVVGCAPTVDAVAATQGAQPLAVLAYQAKHGSLMTGDGTRLIGSFGTLPRNRVALANAMGRMGHVYAAVELRERDMEMRAVWDAIAGRDDGKVVGDHLIVGFDYLGLDDDSRTRVATWGKWQRATQAWWSERLVNAFALVWRQLASAGTGLDVGADAGFLEAQLAAWEIA